MADQVVLARSGFYNSVDFDRLYYAEDMNKPYSRLITNGVFANSDGSESEDLQVQAIGGLLVAVNTGQGIFAGKWFEHVVMNRFEVPFNATTNPRFDNVIVQIDEREEGRCGNIVYREGTPAESPSSPPINTVPGVKEYRIARILVRAGVRTISQADISDLRGSSDCPWVSSAILNIMQLSSVEIDEIISKID